MNHGLTYESDINKQAKTAMCFGTFDRLHPGHIDYLQQARKLAGAAGFLVVVISRDSTVQRLKGKPAQQNELERLFHISSLDFVDCAVLGDPQDHMKIVKLFNPDLICLGYDQTFFTEELDRKLKGLSLDAEIVRLKPHHPELYKSSKLNGKLNGKLNSKLNGNQNSK